MKTSEKSALTEFSNSLLAFIKLKQKNIFELGINFNSLQYPTDEAFTLKALIYFYDEHIKDLDKNLIRQSNVQLFIVVFIFNQ